MSGPLLYTEPAEEVLVLGEMMRANKTLASLLKELPLSGPGGYRGALRVIISQAETMKTRAIRLLGEEDAAREVPALLDAPAIFGVAVEDQKTATGYAQARAHTDSAPNRYTRKEKPVPADLEPAKPKMARKPKASHPWKKTAAPAPVAAESGPTTMDQIIAVLRKKAHSPLELGKALGCANNMQKIYVSTSLMKDMGLIERFTDDEVDGAPRWRLTETAKGATA